MRWTNLADKFNLSVLFFYSPAATQRAATQETMPFRPRNYELGGTKL